MDALSRASLLALTAAALAALLCGCEDGGGGGPSLPVVTITATDASAAEEGSDPGTFTLTRTGETIDDLVVYFSIATGAGEATNDVDYQEQASAGPLPASATIPAGETTVAITIVPVDDAEIEGPETVTLTLSFASTYTVGAPADRTARVTIADNEEPPPEISIAATDAAAAEEGSDPGTFTVSRTGNTADALVVSFTIATGPGEATNGADYVEELSGTDLATSVTIPAGSASTTITVVPVDDSDIEGPETVTLTIAADAAYTVAAAPADTAAVTIAENDFPPEVSIAATDPDAAEEASDPGTFTLTRTGDTTDALVVALAIATGAGEATNGIDYVEELSGTDLATSATIPAGSASTTITIVPADDTDLEGPEAVTLAVAPDAAYVIGAADTAVVTIADNEVPPEVSIAATDAAAAEAGVDVGTFTVSRTGDTVADLVVLFTAVAGTATNDVDYQVSGGALATSVTIPAGSTSTTITIVPVDDAEAEGPETVMLTIAADAAYVVGAAGSAVVTIADDDVPPEVSVAATDAAAAEEGADPGTFEFTRVGSTGGDLVVYFAIETGPGQAVNGIDYVEQASGVDLAASVTIPDGSASATVTIVPVDDGNVELAESVTLTLAADAAYTVAAAPDDTSTVTVADNDSAGLPPMAGPFAYGPETVVDYTWDGSGYVEDTRKTYSYDASGKMTTILEETWNGGAGDWANSRLTTYAYNANDTVDTITVESWAGAWVTDSTTTCSYDASWQMTSMSDGTTARTTFTHVAGLVTRELTEASTDGGGTWAGTQAVDYVYDGSDLLDSGTVEADVPFFGWMEVGTFSQTYDASDRFDANTIEIDAVFIQGTIATGPATYEANGRLLTTEAQADEITGYSAAYHTLAECSYDVDGRLQQVLRYDWDGVGGDWVLTGKTTYTNTDAGSSFTFEHESATPVAIWPLELYGCGDVNPHLWP